jgi:hypothetical protein
VTHEPSHVLVWEAPLLNLEFAVVPCDGPGPALDALRTLRPDVTVASKRDKAMLREQLRPGPARGGSSAGGARDLARFGRAGASVDSARGACPARRGFMI